MAAGKSDVVRKRLLSAGLSQDVCTRYIHVLRSFLSARLTKIQYQDQMAKLLPKDKIHLHNSIIQEILFRAQQKRDGLRDLPLLTPVKKPTPPSRPPPKTSAPPVKKPPPPRVGSKRPRDTTDHTGLNPTPTDNPSATNYHARQRPKLQPTINASPETDSKPKPPPPRLELPEKRSPCRKRQKPPDKVPHLPPPPPGLSAIPTRVASKPPNQVPSSSIAAYDLPFQPLQPGCGIDYQLFVKLRHRMRRIAVEQGGMSTVRDDAVGFTVHAIENHVKRLMHLAVRQRRARDGMRPRDNLQCGPVRGCDLRESARRNPAALGEERVMDLERLSMLI